MQNSTNSVSENMCGYCGGNLQKDFSYDNYCSEKCRTEHKQYTQMMTEMYYWWDDG